MATAGITFTRRRSCFPAFISYSCPRFASPHSKRAFWTSHRPHYTRSFRMPSFQRVQPQPIQMLQTHPSQLDREPNDHSPESLGFLHVATLTSPHGLRGQVKANITTDFPFHRLSPTVNISRFLLLPGRKYPRLCHLIAAQRASRPHTWILKFAGIDAPEHIHQNRLIGARLYVRAEDRPPLARGEFVAADLMRLRVSLRVSHQNSYGELDAIETTLLEAYTQTQLDSSDPPYYVAYTKRGEVLATAPVGIIEQVMTAQQICNASGAGPSAAAVANDVLTVAIFQHPDLQLRQPYSKPLPDSATRVLIPFVKQIVPIVDLDAALVVLDPPPGLLSATVVNSIEKPRTPRALLPPASPMPES